MGDIKKQSIIGTAYVAVGVLLGFLISAIIFPKVLAPNQIGLISVSIAYSAILAQFGSLGFNHITTRLFPYFRNKSKSHNGFFLIALSVSLIGFLLITTIFLVFKPMLIAHSIDKSPLLAKYINYIIPFTFFTLFFNLFDHYYKVLFNAVIGTLFRDVFKRIFILLAVTIYYFQLTTFHGFFFMYMLAVALPVIIMAILLGLNNELNLKYTKGFINKLLRKEMFSVAFFGILSSTTASFTLQIDRIMVDSLMGLTNTGIYTTAFFFGTLVMIPSHVMLKISSAFTAEAWKNMDLIKIDEIYKKSSLILFIGGAFVFLGLWINLDNIFQILPEDYATGRLVIIFIAGSYLIDALAGASSVILVTSKHYRLLTYIKALFIVLLIVTNLIFIPLWGITGAAFASLLSKAIQHTMIFLILNKSYKFQPYNYRFLVTIALAVLTYAISYYLIPVFSSYIVDIAVRSIIVSIIFWIAIYGLKLSFDINNQMNNWLKKYLGITVNYE